MGRVYYGRLARRIFPGLIKSRSKGERFQINKVDGRSTANCNLLDCITRVMQLPIPSPLA